MTYLEKLQMAAEFRAGTALDTGMPAADLASVTATKEPAYITPNGWKLSKVPPPPPDIDEDLSAMNPKRSAKGGRPHKL